MGDGRSVRKAKVIAFIDRLEIDREANLAKLLSRAKIMKMEGFGTVDWPSPIWQIDAGRLTKQTGKNSDVATFNFLFSPKLGGAPLSRVWDDVCKALFILRFHKDNQAAPNQRNFIAAIGYIAYSAGELSQTLSTLTPQSLDDACRKISKHYSESTAYNLHKAVAEFAGHCDANGLCRIAFKYKYAGMKRPESAGGVGHIRLDDPKVGETNNDKIIEPQVFKIIGELYQNVPREHKYRFYVLLLTLLCCLGRRYSEISLLPLQSVESDGDGGSYIRYFPRKGSAGDVFTPLRKLFLPTDVVPIVHSVFDELRILCGAARETAAEMHRTGDVDLRFIAHISDHQRLFKEDLEALGVSPTVLSVNGWIRQNNLSFFDRDCLGKSGRKPRNPPSFTNKIGVSAYCRIDFSKIYIEPIHIDQSGEKYYLKDLLFVRHLGLSSGAYSCWVATQCTHSMMTTNLRYFADLSQMYASSSREVDFTSHHFRHTLNTLMDEGGLSDLLQTEWFGRSNPRDTKAYQHTSREKRALLLREDIKKGRIGGPIAQQYAVLPTTVQEAFLKARVTAVHDIGPGLCTHNFSQTPCPRSLECDAKCDDYSWVKGDDDESRLNELKRRYTVAMIARETAEARSKTGKPGKSIDWIIHNDKKLATLSQQLKDNNIVDFDYKNFLKETGDGNAISSN